MNVTLPLPPTGNHALMPVWIGKSMRLILTPEMRAFKEEAEQTLSLVRPRLVPLQGDVRLDIYVYRQRDSGDADKAVKQIIDALKGYAFSDDKQVAEYHVYRRLDRKNPRVDICIRAQKEF